MQKRTKANTITSALTLTLMSAVLVLPLTGCVTEQEVVTKEQSLVAPPQLNAQLAQDDFKFPSRPPKLSKGKVVFEQNCAACHSVGLPREGMRKSKPIDTYLMLTRGDNGHPSFRDKLTRDQRWEAIFYARYLAGGSEFKMKREELASLFGSNCAVCHGTRGDAEGPLHTGHASAHELGMAPVKLAFDPPPANFTNYSRMYNRTDEQIAKFIKEGVYPSAMPSWYMREDKDKNVVFNDAVIEDLVHYVRQFGYENDLPAEEAQKPASGKKGKQLSANTPDQIGRLEKR